jgi:serralysin
MAMSNNPGTAYAYYPANFVEGGDAWFNRTDYNSPVIGTHAYYVFGHELGHSLGLKHGHELDGVSNVAMNADRDSMEFSIMTYRSYVGASTDGGYTNEAGGYAQSLMMYDIAAIQHMYGAWFGYNSTDTTYTFSTTTGEMFVNGAGQGTPFANRIFRTIWDGDGVDTYDFSNYFTNLSIDLAPGSWSNLDTSGGHFQQANLGDGNHARGHVFNALQYEGDARSLIENANGGSGDDVISGNIANNVLSGNGGNDTIYGYGGNDTIYGGADNDTVDGGDGDDLIYLGDGDDYMNVSSLGNDTFYGGNGNDYIYGYTDNEYYYGEAGNDTLLGYSGNDYLYGGDDNDTIYGGSGNDTADGGDGDDLIYLDDGDDYMNVSSLGNDTFYGGNGNDYIYGYTGNEFYYGEADNDTLLGYSGNDNLSGGDGDDSLTGGDGLDTLTGGMGADRFEFNSLSEGIDTITDFLWEQEDKIVISQAGFGVTSTSQFSYNSSTGELFCDGAVGFTQFATLENLPSGFAVDLDILLVA